MKRMLLLAITILVIVTFLPSPTVQTQQPEKDQFPKLADYPTARANCKNKRQLAPWLGMANVTTKTARCQVSVYNCRTGSTDSYKSSPRNNNPMDCTDYSDWKDRLAAIEVCCDRGELPPEPECEPPTPWFDPGNCTKPEAPQITVNRLTATVTMCGYTVFRENAVEGNDAAYRAALTKGLKHIKVCCDKFREAVRTGQPCDPSKDLDCDGRNEFTFTDGYAIPRITLVNWNHPDVTPFPPNFDYDHPDFLPHAAARAAKEVGECKCKWQLIKGQLQCSPDKKQRHSYTAQWLCPSNKTEVTTVRYAPPTAPCP